MYNFKRAESKPFLYMWHCLYQIQIMDHKLPSVVVKLGFENESKDALILIILLKLNLRIYKKFEVTRSFMENSWLYLPILRHWYLSHYVLCFPAEM